MHKNVYNKYKKLPGTKMTFILSQNSSKFYMKPKQFYTNIFYWVIYQYFETRLYVYKHQ